MVGLKSHADILRHPVLHANTCLRTANCESENDCPPVYIILNGHNNATNGRQRTPLSFYESPPPAVYRVIEIKPKCGNANFRVYGHCEESQWASTGGRWDVLVRRGADKSLARLGRKQATATKLGIYSTYSPRSSKHFLARCANFCKPFKKKIRRLSVQPGLRDSNDLCVGRKMETFQLFFFFSPGNRW